MKKQLCLSIAAIAFVLAGAVSAADESAFAKANQAYNEGRFEEAAGDYENLVRSGNWNANLFYDLGNARFRLGDFGRAILNYERALALDPHHPEADANLRLARDEARALELRTQGFARYIEDGTSTQYSIVASVAFWIALFAAACLFFLRRRSPGLVALIIFSTLIFSGSIYALYALETGKRGKDLAIVTGKNIEARLATADNAS